MNNIYLKYQKDNPKYRIYRRTYEKQYRDNNRLKWNLKSWKSMRKKTGMDISEEAEMNYILKRLLKTD